MLGANTEGDLRFSGERFKYNKYKMFNMATQITVRDVDDNVFREFKAQAIHHGLTLGTALTIAMEKYQSELGGKRKKLLSWKPISWGKESTHVSEEVDSILYGGKG